MRVSFRKVFYILRLSISNREKVRFCLKIWWTKNKKLFSGKKASERFTIVRTCLPGLSSSAQCLLRPSPGCKAVRTCSCPSTWNPPFFQLTGLIIIIILIVHQLVSSTIKKRPWDGYIRGRTKSSHLSFEFALIEFNKTIWWWWLVSTATKGFLYFCINLFASTFNSSESLSSTI